MGGRIVGTADAANTARNGSVRIVRYITSPWDHSTRERTMRVRLHTVVASSCGTPACSFMVEMTNSIGHSTQVEVTS